MYLLGLFAFCGATLHAQTGEQEILKEANARFDQGRYAEAMPLYSQLLSLNATKPEFHFKYGATALYGDADKKQEAIKYLRYAAGKPGVDPLCYYFLGRAYHLNYQFADAVKAYEKFAQLSPRGAEQYQISRELESCRSGQKLLANIKDVKVLDKKQSAAESFFRLYDLSDIGGRILVTPEELLTPLDKKRNHKSLIHFRGAGSEVFFSSYGKDGKTGLDIYRASVLPNGAFTTPVALGPEINTPYDEDYPFMHPDGSTFYFSSKGHKSMGGYDIFKARFDPSTGKYTPPENLDFAVNTPDDDIFYIADSLHRMANFASARSSKQGELHVYQVEVSSNPLEMTLIKGLFANRVVPRNKTAKVTVVDVLSNQEVDVQYTDGQSGDYLLSFPRSGKFKFLVEVQGSDMLHAGTVDIPKSAGISAYVQEMELISSGGIEKLLINNKFDTQYDGDLAELAQSLLRTKALLDVNFYGQPDDKPLAQASSGPDFEKAFSAAGFGAGLSNEKILEQAEQSTEALNDNLSTLRELIEGANHNYLQALSEAEKLTTEADELYAKSTGADDAEQGRLMFEAGLARIRAREAISRAKNTEALREKLVQKEASAAQKYNLARQRTDSLETALSSGNYELALRALKREKQVREGTDKVADRFDPVSDVRMNSITAENDARKKMEKAAQYRSEADALQGKLTAKTNQRSSAKGKDAKAVDDEIARLKDEIGDLRNAAERSYADAEKWQADAHSQSQQYEILATLFTDKSQNKLKKAPGERFVAAQSRTTNQLEVRLDRISPDHKAIARYILNHPDATARFGNERELMLFRKAYPDEQADKILAAATPTDKSQGDTAQLALKSPPVSTSKPGGKSDGTTESNISSIEKAAEIESDKPTPAEAEAGLADAAMLQRKPENITSEPTGKADDKPQTIDAEQASENDGVAETITIAKEPTVAPIKNETPASANQTSTTRNESTSPQDPSATAEAERIKINAARDWVTILDESISELKSGVGGDDAEDIQEQLQGYEKLREEKLAEIARSEAQIASIESQPAKAPVSYSDAVAEAEMDLDALDASLLARLENRMQEEATRTRHNNLIKAIDRNYLPALAANEMSGKSAPEISTGRIELNETLIASITTLLSGEADSELNEDELLELRRVKTLELRQDRDILEGKTDYQPRSPEAMEYVALLRQADETLPALTKEPEAGTTLDAPGLAVSPEMARSLAEPFTRDALLKGYNEQKLAQVDQNSIAQLSRRLDTNKALMTALQSEISIYAAAVRVPGNEASVALKLRYEELLAERSTLVDEITADNQRIVQLRNEELAQTELKKKKTSGQDESKKAAEIEAVTQSSISASVREEEALYFNRYYNDERSKVLEKNLSPSNELLELATLNQLLAGVVESRIEELSGFLDIAKSDQDRDNLQLAIQELDAMGANYLQEADRLTTESQGLQIDRESQAAIETNSADAEADRELAAQLALDVESLRNAAKATIEMGKLAYKSLSANMHSEELNRQVSSLQEERSRADAILNEFNATTDIDKRNALYDEFIQVATTINRLDQEVKEEINRTNLAEIAFYTSSNQQISESIDTDPGLTFAEREAFKAIVLRQTELTSSLNDNRSRMDAADELSSSDRDAVLQNELLIIKDLAAINKEYDALRKNVDKRLAAEALAAAPTSADTPAELNPRSYEPLPDHAYMTPLAKSYGERMTDNERKGLLQQAGELNPNFDFAAYQRPEQHITLVSGALKIDEAERSELLSKPTSLAYIASKVKADSLRKVEYLQADLQLTYANDAKERFAESERLKLQAASTSDTNDRKLLEKRADKIMQEAQVFYKYSALAASNAEAARNLRMEVQSGLVTASAQLPAAERTALDAVSKGEPYRIISSDLASDKPMPAPVEKKPTTAELLPVTKPVPSAATEAKTKDEDAPVATYWLGMVEIIADKTDFSDVRETMFVETEKPAYSTSRPIPIDPAMPPGLIFQVQIGAFRKPIPQELFGEFAPVMGQRLDNGIVRYRAGLFNLYADALGARDAIRAKGYKDAFVVAYLDGDKLSSDEARYLLKQIELASVQEPATKSKPTVNQATSEKAIPEPSTAIASIPAPATESPIAVAEKLPEVPSYYNDPNAARADMVEVTPGLFFTVQVGVYSKPVALDKLYGLSELNSELTANGTIRYTTGRFNSIEDAAPRRDGARSAGVNDAFITAYHNGKRIGINDANKLLKDQGQSVLASFKAKPPVNEPAARYVVVLGRFTDEVPQELADIFLEKVELRIRRIDDQDGASLYLSPVFEQKQDAEAYAIRAISEGVEGAYVATWDGEGLLR